MLGLVHIASEAMAQSVAGTALIRHAPTLNGAVDGSIHQMAAESTTLNSGASVSGSLFVPGMPTVQLNGSAVYGGTQEGTGLATPTNHKITLNSGATLAHVVRRTEAKALPVVSAPPLPAGTRNVTLNSVGQSPGDFSTLKNLTLNSSVGLIAVPPGIYGSFGANAGSGFTLGVVGAMTPAVYHFQSLTLNSGSTFSVVGPVIVTLKGDISTGASMGSPDHPEWLELKIADGGLTIASDRLVHAHLEAPNGGLTLNAGSRFTGLVASDRLVINSTALLRLVEPPPGLPFVAGFEAAEGYALGPVHGQKGWTATNSAVVTDADFASGLRSVLIPGGEPPLSLTRFFVEHPDRSVVYVDVFALPQAAASEAASAKLSLLNTAELAFVRSGDAGRFFVRSGDGAGGGVWLPSRAAVSVDAGGFATGWVRLTLRLDYSAKEWDFYVDGTMAAVQVGFGSITQTTLGSITLTGQTTAPTLLDDFLAGFENPLFADVDHDGMADAWETAHGLNPALDDRDADKDVDGLTNVKEYLLGTAPDNPDSDGDGLGDVQEGFLGTNPILADSDGDGMPDGWEQANGLNPLSASDASLDSDGDGVSNLLEYQQGKDPNDYYNGVLPEMTSLVGANGELGPDDTIQMRVTDAAGQPLVNAPVTFVAQSGGHQLAATLSGPASNEVTVRTGSDGIARAYVRGGSN